MKWQKSWQKISMLGLAGAMVLGLASCGQKDTKLSEAGQARLDTAITAAADAGSESLAAALKEADGQLAKIYEAGVLTMGTSPDFAPMEFIDPNKSGQEQYVGSDVLLGRYIAEKLGVDFMLEAMDFDTTLASVSQKKVDLAIAGLAWSPERAESMLLSGFYNKEDDEGYQGILISSEQAGELNSAEAFKNLKVGAQNGSLQQQLTQSQLPQAKVEVITNLNDGILMLANGKIDALAISSEQGDMAVGSYPDLEMSAFKFDSESEGNVIGMAQGEESLAEAVNAILEEVDALGLYSQWKIEMTDLAASLNIEMP